MLTQDWNRAKGKSHKVQVAEADPVPKDQGHWMPKSCRHFLPYAPPAGELRSFKLLCSASQSYTKVSSVADLLLGLSRYKYTFIFYYLISRECPVME